MAEEKSESVRIIENELIPLKDGVKLSARIWLPAVANESQPVPAVFEFVPYGKRDGTTYRDEITYDYFGQHGYAGVRVDMRGSGNSMGIAADEYVKQEQDDAIGCIEWISEQPWCTGRVGMMGISWGGFNSLQVAARQPEPLKAIIAMCFTDDRFSDDIHFKGGAMLMDKVVWSTYMGLVYSLPPDPKLSEDWLSIWLNRMENLPPAAELWLQQPTRGAYYKQGSICEDYSKIQVPSMLIGGFGDGYTNCLQRTYDNIQCPKRAILGPWIHLYPHISAPSPLWGFCTEAVHWFDQWLKEDKPSNPNKFIMFVQSNMEVPCKDEVDGGWIEDPVSGTASLYFSEGKLGDEKGESIIDICSLETCGQQLVTFFPLSLSEMPLEQSPDDKLSCVFETDIFDHTIDYVGRPTVTLSVASDKSIANVFIRLCIVNEKGISRLIGFTAVNLNMSDDYATITKLELGAFKSVKTQLDLIGETVQPGYKLRLAVSSTLFPSFVPNPERVTLSLDLSGCQLDLPILLSSKPLSEEIPEVAGWEPQDAVMRKPATSSRTANVNDLGQLVITMRKCRGEKEYLANGLVTERVTEHVESISPRDPNSARLQTVETACWSRGEDWVADVRYTMDFTMDKDYFKTHETREAKHNGKVVFSREYNSQVKREGH